MHTCCTCKLASIFNKNSTISIGEGRPLQLSTQLREGGTWRSEGGRGHLPSQPDQPKQPWRSMGWQMSQPDCPCIQILPPLGCSLFYLLSHKHISPVCSQAPAIMLLSMFWFFSQAWSGKGGHLLHPINFHWVCGKCLGFGQLLWHEDSHLRCITCPSFKSWGYHRIFAQPH